MYTIKDLKEQNLIIFEVLSGSNLYGLNTETSDKDYRGIYIQPFDSIIENGFIPQVEDEKGDTVYYEIRTFAKLMYQCKPNAIELLYADESNILFKDDMFDEILKIKDFYINNKFIKYTIEFGLSQIKKAKGLDKKIKMDKTKMKRKTVIDFCYTNNKQGSINITSKLKEMGLKQEYCGLISIPHYRGGYGIYYDFWQHVQFEKLSFTKAKDLYKKYKPYFNVDLNEFSKRINDFKNLKYKGIVNKENSNTISLSQPPKDALPIIETMFYNEDGYKQHCRLYKEYLVYLRERNVNRYTDYKNHGQVYDGKNLLHMRRVLNMGLEYVSSKKININRRFIDRDELLAIKKGDVILEDILNKGLEDINLLQNVLDKKESLNNDEGLYTILMDKVKKMYKKSELKRKNFVIRFFYRIFDKQ